MAAVLTLQTKGNINYAVFEEVWLASTQKIIITQTYMERTQYTTIAPIVPADLFNDIVLVHESILSYTVAL